MEGERWHTCWHSTHPLPMQSSPTLLLLGKRPFSPGRLERGKQGRKTATEALPLPHLCKCLPGLFLIPNTQLSQRGHPPRGRGPQWGSLEPGQQDYHRGSLQKGQHRRNMAMCVVLCHLTFSLLVCPDSYEYISVKRG